MKIVCIVGSDGSGKTTLAKHLVEELEHNGHTTKLVWMRFNNYLSKVLLAFARLRGYSYSKYVDGIKMGFHDFEKVWWLRWPFAFLQMIDVNIAAWFMLRRLRNVDIVVFERSPWDTLSDVMADTGLIGLEKHWIGHCIVNALKERSKVLCVNRDVKLIRQSRSELKEDAKLALKIDNYHRMAEEFNWIEIDNNRSIDDAMRDILKAVLGDVS